MVTEEEEEGEEEEEEEEGEEEGENIPVILVENTHVVVKVVVVERCDHKNTVPPSRLPQFLRTGFHQEMGSKYP